MNDVFNITSSQYYTRSALQTALILQTKFVVLQFGVYEQASALKPYDIPMERTELPLYLQYCSLT